MLAHATNTVNSNFPNYLLEQVYPEKRNYNDNNKCKNLESVAQLNDVQSDWAACGCVWDYSSYSQDIFGFVQARFFFLFSKLPKYRT